MTDFALHSQPLSLGRTGQEGDRRFKELDDLVLHLKGLVLVRDLRAGGGADGEELGMFSTEIDRARDRLARLLRDGARWGRSPGRGLTGSDADSEGADGPGEESSDAGVSVSGRPAPSSAGA